MLGQDLVARRMGKKRIIAETGAGQHGVATATMCARFGLECIVYMGAVDVERQAQRVPDGNAGRQGDPGAVRHAHAEGCDERGAARRVTNVHDTFYCIGTVAGPHPYPMMVRDFQSIIGVETRAPRCRKPKAGCRIRWSPASAATPMRSVYSIRFSMSRPWRYSASRPRGLGLTQLHAASIAGGRAGVLHGNRTYLLMDEDGQIQDAHSISAGLDYPGIGPEHSWLYETKRVTYLSATDDEALAAFQLLSRQEGIIPALESAHAIAKVMELAPKRPKDHLMVVNLSGRGDKDIPQVAEILKGRRSDHPHRRPLR